MSASPAGPTHPSAGRYESELQPLLEDFIRRQSVPGFTMAVIDGFRVAYTYNNGWTDSQCKDSITNRSLFHMASVTKPFTATAIMQLVERRKLDIDAAVDNYLPYFRVCGKHRGGVTVRQLLTHTSGLPDVTEYRWGDPNDDQGALERYVRGLGELKLESEPGSVFRYSNIGYDILGDIVAKASGCSYEGFLRDHILKPLGMGNSAFLFGDVDRRYLVSGNVSGPEGDPRAAVVYPYNRAHFPSSGLISNAADMSRWCLASVQARRAPGSGILKVETHEEMWRPHGELSESDSGIRTSVGLGWFLKEYRGKVMVTHSGGDTGFLSDLAMIPDLGIAVVWMSNCDWIDSGPLNGPITYAALDVALGVKPQPIRILRNLEKALRQAYREEGIEAALRRYETLRALKPDVFDFGEAQLGGWGSRLLSEDRTKDAIRVLELNVHYNPSSAEAHNRLAKANELDGNIAAAISHYRKALEIDPASSHSIMALKTLQAPSSLPSSGES